MRIAKVVRKYVAGHLTDVGLHRISHNCSLNVPWDTGRSGSVPHVTQVICKCATDHLNYIWNYATGNASHVNCKADHLSDLFMCRSVRFHKIRFEVVDHFRCLRGTHLTHGVERYIVWRVSNFCENVWRILSQKWLPSSGVWRRIIRILITRECHRGQSGFQKSDR